MSTIDTVQSLLDTYGTKETTASTSSNDLDKEAFLNLLVTQMQYQDPLEPTSDQEYLAQMAQFSALEEMQNLNTSFQMQQASSLIDKYVQGTSYNETSGVSTEVIGIVDAVNMKSGVPYLLVDSQEIALSDISTIISDFGSETVAMISSIDTMSEKITAIEALLTQLMGSESSDDTTEDTETTVSTDTETEEI
jgi:flagellar basal-body rod modification protein FlgD